ncbi:unnamed protein product, partial [Dovyalis caffra]
KNHDPEEEDEVPLSIVAWPPLTQPFETPRWKLPSLMPAIVLENQKQMVMNKQNTFVTTKPDQVTNLVFDLD